MRTSCINHPPQDLIVIKYQWQMEACDGDGCAAGLLSFFEYWHNIKLRNRLKAEHANEVAQLHGYEPTQDITLFQWHTSEDLKAALLEYGKKRIRDAIQLLVDKGFISLHRNPNPKYGFDNTKHFLFHPEIINNWLQHYRDNLEEKLIVGTNRSHRCGQNVTFDRNKVDRLSSQNGPMVVTNRSQQYPKITSETTSEKKIESEGEPIIVAQAQPYCVANVVEEIFQHWKQIMSHPQARLDDKRKRVIRKALQMGYDVNQLCEAITGCSLTPFNMGVNESNQRYNGIGLILRDAEHIERFMKNASQGAGQRASLMGYEKNKIYERVI